MTAWRTRVRAGRVPAATLFATFPLQTYIVLGTTPNTREAQKNRLPSNALRPLVERFNITQCGDELDHYTTALRRVG